MRLDANDVRTRPEPPPTMPASRSWRIQIAVGLVGLLAGLLWVLWFVA